MNYNHVNLLICPTCRTDTIVRHEEYIECKSCRKSYSTANNVVNLLGQFDNTSSSVDIADYVHPIMQKLGFRGEQHVVHELEDILRESIDQQASTSYLTAEMHDVIDRFQVYNVDYSAKYLKHYIKELPVGETVFRNVRIKNAGKFPWSSKTSPPLYMSYHWIRNGEMHIHDGERTAFPVDIESGREVTIPLKISTPSEPGEYKLQIMLIHEGVRWVEESKFEIDVSVGTFSIYPIAKNENRGYRYENDHQAGKEIIEEYIKRKSYGSLELLEIGGGSHPQTALLNIPVPYRTINVDINLSLLKIGSLFYRYHYPDAYKNMTFMSFDANQPPIKQESFDGIVLFSALHHFPEPDRLLETCYGLLKSNGFLAIMCEPVNQSIYNETTIKDLSKGINEQVFSEMEYLDMFKSTKLKIELIQIDSEHSLKVILSK